MAATERRACPTGTAPWDHGMEDVAARGRRRKVERAPCDHVRRRNGDHASDAGGSGARAAHATAATFVARLGLVILPGISL